VSKESRRRQRAAASGSVTGPRPARPTPSGGDGAASPPIDPSHPPAAPGGVRPSTSPTGTPRVGRRTRTRTASSARPGFLERYRTLLIGLAAVAVIAVVGVGLFAAATTPAFACSNVWVPDPTPTPGATASPQPGYVQPDMGNGHVGTGSAVTFTYCPPASGRHWNAQGNGPIAPRVYGPDDVALPQGWIHNLEHGGIVVLYRGDGPGATEEGQAALRALFDDYPPSPVCGFEAGTSSGPVIARFDEMATPYAALVWGRVLPLETLDREAIIEFDATFGERTNPEQFCQPSPSPSASGSPAASVSPAASEAPAPSSSPAPSGSPAASPSAS
jgi:hypothetical protein